MKKTYKLFIRKQNGNLIFKKPLTFLLILFFSILFTPSHAQNSLALDGAGDYVSLGNMNLSGAQFTVEFWVKGTLIRQIINQQKTDNTQSITMYSVGTPAELVIAVKTSTAANANRDIKIGLVSKIADNQWHHIAFTFNAGTAKTYLDGVLANTVIMSPTITSLPNLSATTPVYIGRNSTGGGASVCFVDEYRIWNVERNATQILDNMFQQIDPATTGLRSYYRFNGNANDEKNVANGTLFGNATATNNIIPFTNWLETTDSDWGTTSNWESNTVPAADNPTYVFVGDVTNAPIVGGNYSAANLILKTNAVVSINTSNTLTVAESLTNNSSFTGDGVLKLSGASTTYNIKGIFNKLTVNGSAGATLTANTTVNGELYFENSAKLSLGNFNLLLNQDASTTGDGSGWIIADVDAGTGKVVLQTPATSSPYQILLGDETVLSPVSINLNSFNGTQLTFSLNNIVHPNFEGTADNIARFWTLSSDATSINYDITCNYNSGEVTGTPTYGVLYPTEGFLQLSAISGNSFSGVGLNVFGDFSASIPSNFNSYSSFNFNGTNYLQSSNTPALNASAFTIEAWVKGSSIRAFYCKYLSSSLYINQYQYNGSIIFGVNGPSSSATCPIATIAEINDNNWHHVAVTYSGTSLKTYFDGNLAGTSNLSSLPTISTNVVIGKNLSNGTYANMLLDEYRIWNVARTQAEIKANMFDEIDPNTSGLTCYLPFNRSTIDKKGFMTGITTSGTKMFSQEVAFSNFLATTADANDATNWQSGNVPTATNPGYVLFNDETIDPIITSLIQVNNLIVNPGAIVTVNPKVGSAAVALGGAITVNGNLINDGAIRLNSPSNRGLNGSLIVYGDESGTGNYTVKRFLYKDYWNWVSSPVSGLSIPSVFGSNPNVKVFEEGSYSYQPSTGQMGGNMMIATGYNTIFNTYKTLTFSGTGVDFIDRNINVTYTGAPSVATRGWNLLGNPFTSAVDAENFVYETGVDKCIYVQSGGNFIYYLAQSGTLPTGGTGTASFDGIIPSCMGFMVHTNAPSTLRIPKISQVHNDNNLFNKEQTVEAPTIRLTIAADEYADETIIYFAEGATNEHDGDFDAYKLINFDENYPNLYSITPEGVNAAINSLPIEAVNQTVTIPLGINCLEGEYSINVNNLTIEGNAPIYLEDTETGKMTNLRKVTTYNFTYSGGVNDNRFNLLIAPVTTGTEEVENAQWANVYSFSSDIFVQLNTNNQAVVNVYDLSGKLIVSETVNNVAKLTVPSTGLYIVNVVSENETLTTKVFVK